MRVIDTAPATLSRRDFGNNVKRHVIRLEMHFKPGILAGGGQCILELSD